MQIPGTGDAARMASIRRILDRRRAGGAAATEGAEAGAAADEVALSTVSRLLGELDALPEIRAERVARIRAQIEDGSYETEDKLAAAVERILQDFSGLAEEADEA